MKNNTASFRKVLIVEDEPALSSALKQKFIHAGFETIEAQNGKLGLHAALTQKPDLIVLDVVMPVMDGLTMLKELRSKKKGSLIPVIIFTNLSEKEVFAQLEKNELIDCYSKTRNTLQELVARANEMLAEPAKNLSTSSNSAG